jgi:hypothetical protein
LLLPALAVGAVAGLCSIILITLTHRKRS